MCELGYITSQHIAAHCSATCRRLKPFRLVSATATGNRLFILSLQSSARQWRKHESDLRKIASSFEVPPV